MCSIPVIIAYNLVPGWIALTLGVTFGAGLGFAGTALAGALFPYRAKEVYAGIAGREIQVNSYMGMLLGLIGLFAFAWAGWVLAPQAFASSPSPDVAYPTAADSAAPSGSCCSSASRSPDGSRAKVCHGPPRSDCLGGGLGQAMVLAFLLAPALGVWALGTSAPFPTHLWAQIIAVGLILFCVAWYAWTKRSAEVQGHQHRLRLQGNPAGVRSFSEYSPVHYRTRAPSLQFVISRFGGGASENCLTPHFAVRMGGDVRSKAKIWHLH